MNQAAAYKICNSKSFWDERFEAAIDRHFVGWNGEDSGYPQMRGAWEEDRGHTKRVLSFLMKTAWGLCKSGFYREFSAALKRAWEELKYLSEPK